MKTQKCEYCDNVFKVHGNETDEYNYRTGKGTVYVYWTDDPFQSEIHGDDTMHWLCSKCIHDCLWEI